MDDKFIKRLASNQPAVIKKIVDYFKQLLGKATDKDLAKELRAIVNKVEDATKNIGKNADANVEKSKFAKEIVSKADEKKYPIAKRQTRNIVSFCFRFFKIFYANSRMGVAYATPIVV